MVKFDFLKICKSQNVLVVLLGFFILFDIDVPKSVAGFLNTVFGKILVFSLAVSSFSLGPLCGSLAMVAAYVLFVRSNVKAQITQPRSVPSENKKVGFFQNTENNTFPKTLEEQMVQDMVPLVTDSNIKDYDSYDKSDSIF